MKKIMGVLFALLLMIPLFSINAKEKEMVKVYIFEAGGCPYCEAEVEYLEKLDSYNKKFTIERRELYIDHVDWAKGRDYELGKAVAEKFIEDGFEDASYKGTPFIVISNVYAAATYSTSLESYIDKAYKEGDKDVVSTIAKKLKVENVNRTDIGAGESKTTTTDSGTTSTYDNEDAPNLVIVLLGLVVLVGAMVLIIKLGNKNDGEDNKEDSSDKEVKEVKKTTTKRTTTKKTPVKKQTKTVKKTNKK